MMKGPPPTGSIPKDRPMSEQMSSTCGNTVAGLGWSSACSIVALLECAIISSYAQPATAPLADYDSSLGAQPEPPRLSHSLRIRRWAPR